MACVSPRALVSISTATHSNTIPNDIKIPRRSGRRGTKATKRQPCRASTRPTCKSETTSPSALGEGDFPFFFCLLLFSIRILPSGRDPKRKSSQYKLIKNRRENRICPGYNVAERSLAVAIMRILWAFEVTPSPDAKLPLNIADWRGDFPGLAGPTMPVMMLPRSKERVAVIDEAFAAAKMEREAIVS